MALPERVLIDMSALYALFSPSDDFHDQARYSYELLVDEDRELWITSYTLVETTALLRRRLGFQVIAEFSAWHTDNLEVFWVQSREHNEAWDRYISERGQGLSFVDWTIAIASRQIDAHIFTFDGGFARQGLPVVPR